jgi:hypothetical protein
MCVAFRLLGQNADANTCLQALRTVGVVKDPAEGRGGVFAASRDGMTTGFVKEWGEKKEPWVYYRRPHVGATCWYIFAELGWNPYWGEAVKPLRP